MYVDQRFTLLPSLLDRVLNETAHLDLTPGPGGSRFSPYRDSYDRLAPLLTMVFPAIAQIAVVALEPSAQIVGHADVYPDQHRRYHIPIALNPACWVFHDDTWQRLEVGRVYQMDPTKVHGAVNWGPTRRLHLMVDIR